MFGLGVYGPEDTTLPRRANGPRHLKSQFLETTDDQVLFSKRMTRKVGHSTLAIRHAFSATKNH